ncbi:helix-turn-helix domain-containing protein [Cryobacterium sp. TMS1-13-1]|uniref:helix-turn-helix domain-containing protein n=1 Tax=Cryobacterium sp. TMS1-13-1 TaxID=1259220 RepID=UPI00106BAE7D|nr:helix-turn-helix domain-containing protein [Cryobacterium sp. TMS1-13-1]TFD21384.1 hypothetical protein E3T31_11225 [Cryobacterium sp. TMS1-13-1]
MDGDERWRVLRLHVEDQVPLAALARDTGISARTLQRWHQLYRGGGIGSDFTSHHLERTAIELHIRLIHSIVGRPQGRGKIERFFGTINTELLTALPGHLGPGSRMPEPELNLPDLDRAIGGFIATYNARIYSELGTSPHDARVAGGWLPRMPDSLEELDGLLLTVPKSRTVQRDGIPSVAAREETRAVDPAPHRRRLRTYEED